MCRSLYRLDQLGIPATRAARDPLLKVLDHRHELFVAQPGDWIRVLEFVLTRNK